jgi:FkbM family methyltransferase
MAFSFNLPIIKSLAGLAVTKLGFNSSNKNFYPIFGGPAAGQKILLNRNVGMQVLSGRSDMRNMKALKKLMLHRVVLKKDAVILNAGAGFGLYELFFAKYLGNQCNTYSFESGTGAQELLEKNMAANKIENNTIVKKAISGKIGIINFFENPLFGSSLIEEEAKQHNKKAPVAKTVFTTTIDIFCKRYGLSPSFIRLNVCGGTDQALNGAMETIEKSKPVILVNPHRPEERKAIVQLMNTYQYEAFSINEFEWLRVKDEDDELEDILEGTMLLCPYQLKEDINYAMFNRYRRDAGAVEKWLPENKPTGGYAFN